MFTQQPNWIDFELLYKQVGRLGLRRLLYWVSLKGVTVKNLANQSCSFIILLVYGLFCLLLLLRFNQAVCVPRSSTIVEVFSCFTCLNKTLWICRIVCLPSKFTQCYLKAFYNKQASQEMLTGNPTVLPLPSKYSFFNTLWKFCSFNLTLCWRYLKASVLLIES